MYCIVLIFVFQFSYGQAYVPDWKYFDTLIYSRPIGLIDFESSSFKESAVYNFDSIVCYNPHRIENNDFLYQEAFKSLSIESNQDKDSLYLYPIVTFSYERDSKIEYLFFNGNSVWNREAEERSIALRSLCFRENGNKYKEVEADWDTRSIIQNSFTFLKPFSEYNSIAELHKDLSSRIDSFRLGAYPEIFNSAHMIELGSQQIIFNQPIKNFAGLPNYEGCPKNGSFGIYNFKETIPFSFGKPEKPFKLHPFITQKDALKYRGSSPEEALRLYQFGYGDVLVNTVCDDFDVSEENRTYNLDLKDETHIDVKKVLKFKCDGVNFIAFNYDLHYSYYNIKNNFVRKNNTQVLRYDFEDKTWKVTKSYNYTMDHIIHILSRLKYDVLFKFVGNFSKGPDSSWTQQEKDVYEFCGGENFYVQRLIILINYWRETEQQDKLDALFGKDMMIQDLLFEILFSPKEYQENNDYSGGWDE